MDLEIKKLFYQIQSNDNSEIMNATIALTHTFRDIYSFFSFFNEYKDDINDSFRLFCVIMMRSVLVKAKTSEIAEISANICETILEGLTFESNLVIQMNMCDILGLLDFNISIKYIISAIEKMMEISSNYTMILFLLRCLIGNRNHEDLINTCKEMAIIAISSMNSKNQDLSLQSKLYLKSCIKNDALQEFLDESSEFSLHVIDSIHRCVNINDINGSIAAFSLAESSIKRGLDCFMDCQLDLASFITELVINTSIDHRIRLKSTDTMSKIIQISIDSMTDMIEAIFHNFLLFSIELYDECMDSFDYMFPINFISSLEESNELSEYSDVLYDCAFSLIQSDQESGVIVGIMVITGLINSSTDFAIDHDEEIVSLVMNAIEIENTSIIRGISDLVSQFCSTVPSSASKLIGIISQFLIPHINDSIVLNAVIVVFEQSTTPPPNIDGIIQELVDIFVQTDEILQETVLTVLCACFRHNDVLSDTLCSSFIPVLVEFFSGDLPKKVLSIRCLAQMMDKLPDTYQDTIMELLSAVMDLFSCNRSEIVYECCCFLNCVVSRFTNTITQNIECIIEQLLRVLTINEDETESFEDDDLMFLQSALNSENDSTKKRSQLISYQKMKTISLEVLSHLCVYYPTMMTENFSCIFDSIKQFLEMDDDIFVVSACDSLLMVAESYKILNYDASSIIQVIIDYIEKIGDISMIAKMWDTIGTIIHLFGSEIVQTKVNEIHTCLFSVFSHSSNRYNQKGDKTEIVHELQESVFYVLDQLIIEIDHDHQYILTEYVPYLLHMARSHRKKSKPKASNILAKLFGFMKENHEIIEVATEQSIIDLKSKSIDIRILAISTLCYIVQHFPEEISNQSSDLMEIISEIINLSDQITQEDQLIQYNAIVLYFSICQSYDIGKITFGNFDKIPILFDMQSFDGISKVICFLLSNNYLTEKVKMSIITILSSNEPYIRHICKEDAQMMIYAINNEYEELILRMGLPANRVQCLLNNLEYLK